MPITFLTLSERKKYEQIPDEFEEGVLVQFFHLDFDDLIFIRTFYSNTNRVAVGIKIGLLRYLGFIPNGWKETLPIFIYNFIVNELRLECSFNQFLGYGKREQTETDHLIQILKHLKFRKWQALIDEPLMEKWLVEQGMEHHDERYLLAILCKKLHQEKILRPAIGTLEALVANIGEQLEMETYQRLSIFWTEDFVKKLDTLLEVDSSKKITLHRWLCITPSTNTAKAINQMFEKIDFLTEIGVKLWDLSSISENRKKLLADAVRRDSNAHLKRFNPIKRYPMLVCFLRESFLDITDMILVMYTDYWQQINNKAKKAMNMSLLENTKLQQNAVKIVTQIGKIVLDENIDNESLRSKIYENLSKTQIQEALQTLTEKQLKCISYLSFLKSFYPTMKQFTANLLAKMDFRVAFTKDNFDSALTLVKDLQTGKKRKMPQDAPMNFINSNWQKTVVQNQMIHQQNYELCVLSMLKDRLQSGDVYLDLSRKFTNLESLLLGKDYYKTHQEHLYQKLALPNLSSKIDEKVEELATLLPKLSETLIQATDIRIENDNLIVSPLNTDDLPPSAQILQEQINGRLPKVSLAEIIQEVDVWVNYANELENYHSAKNPQHQHLKYAALFANACNLSLADLARSSDLEYQALWWVTHNYLLDENLKKANNLLVNYHHKQWLSNYWGGGTLSSSDGQRFPTSGKIRNAKALPKYFGYNQGVSVYTHTADQYSQFGSQIISVHERDATYVLNEILANQTDLLLDEHTTDTHGYTDLNFALFDLVGKQFSPRIRDLKNQRLYKITGKEITHLNYPPLKFTGSINIDYLKKYADDMNRVAASLKMGTVTPSTLIAKLQAYPKQNNLMYVLQSYGQLVKTIFICKYLINQPLRKKINSQLNKGEQLHGLRAYLWFGGDGIIRKKQEKQQQVTARCLNLLTNIIIVWNTVYIQEIIKQLQREGFHIDENDFEHISPAPFEHINRLGKYSFNAVFEKNNNGLRPLRKI
jgi:TnpA family transposase